MKFSFVKIGVAACLAAGLFSGQVFNVSAQEITETTVNKDPSLQVIDEMLTGAALNAGIPPEVVKAVAYKESGWRQYVNGEPYINEEGEGVEDDGIGIMQITNKPLLDQNKLRYDIEYNIEQGVKILNDMYNWEHLPEVKNGGKTTIESWYFPVMAYNGIKPTNSPIKKLDGTPNPNAYQELVFDIIERDSYLNSTQLGNFSFETTDFQYNPDSDENIVFEKQEYTVDEPHDSAYFFKANDRVVVTGEDVKLRSQPNTDQKELDKLAKNTTLTITGDFQYDQSIGTDDNRFVWYPVKTAVGQTGFMSSAYIKRAETAFTDVAPSYQEAVNYLVSKGINGKSETTFGTQEPITRLDAAIFVAKAAGLNIDAAPNAGFTDVPANRAKYVNALKAANITNGKSTTTFGAYDLITRGDLARWLVEAFDLRGESDISAFTDVPSQYRTAISALVSSNITKGTSPVTFGTYDNAKRGDFAKFVFVADNAALEVIEISSVIH